MTDSDVDLKEARCLAAEAAEAAGQLLTAGVGGRVDIWQKDASGDVVSELDYAAEKLIVERLRAAYPEHRVIAEETGESGQSAQWTWLVDPLDGTNNLAIGLPAYVVGIALCAGRHPVVSVIHDPVAGRTWSAVRGEGALCGETTLRPQPRPVAGGPVLAWTQGHSVARDDPTNRALKLVLDTGARRVLQLWAPLLGWAMLARGDIDGVVGYQPEAIDLPAGVLLAQEAGMVVRGLDGAEFDERIGLPARARSFVAAPPDRIDRLVKLVATAGWVEPELSRVPPSAW